MIELILMLALQNDFSNRMYMQTNNHNSRVPRVVVHDNRVYNFPAHGRVRFSDRKRDVYKQAQTKFGMFKSSGRKGLLRRRK